MSKYILFIIVLFLFFFSEMQAREITIAVVKDRPSSEELLIGKIETELQKLVKAGTNIHFEIASKDDEDNFTARISLFR